MQLAQQSDAYILAIVWRKFCTLQAGEFVAKMVLIEEDGHYLVDHAMVF